MNEAKQRIKQLADQATTYHNGGLGTEIELFDKEKFAELIIRECAGLCENSNYQFGTIFTKMIKEHFGVAEREE